MLSIESVTLSRGGRTVLADVNLDIGAGEIVALVGPNGAGKSTLLSVAAGDLSPDSGSVEISGHAVMDTPTPELARLRSVLTQHNSVGFAFTAGEIIAMGRTPWAKQDSPQQAQQAIDEAIDACGVRAFVPREYHELSGGERARVSLARVLAQTTPLVLLDEPTAALDVKHQEDVMRICRQRADEGTGIGVVLHDLSLAASWSDRIVVLDDGRIVADGPAEDVLTPELLSAVYDCPMFVLTSPDGTPLIVPDRSGRTVDRAIG